MKATQMTAAELTRIFSENTNLPIAAEAHAESEIDALANDHAAACYEDEGEAAYGRDE